MSVEKKRDYLVFTSAGENANIRQWCKGADRNFDLCVVNYSDTSGLHRNEADIYHEAKGGKLANLKKIHQLYPDLISSYKAVWVADDDVVIETEDINRLFQLHTEKALTLLQPAFTVRGKISHPITKRQFSTSLRYTNFVEITCPLIESSFLQKFLTVYDPVLVGWGIDWWMLNLLEPHQKVAISDDIVCTNPFDFFKKDGKREIVRLQSNEDRLKTWAAIKTKHNLKDFPKQVLAQEPKKLPRRIASIPSFAMDYVVGAMYRVAKKR